MERAYIEPLNMIACETLEELAEYIGREYTTKEIWGQIPEALARAAGIGEEAQHRKTWALAMEAAAATFEDRKERYGSLWQRQAEGIRALPCPPIEATKEK